VGGRSIWQHPRQVYSPLSSLPHFFQRRLQHDPRKSLPNILPSFLLAPTPTPAICQSEFYTRPIHFTPRMFRMPFCFFRLLSSRSHRVIHPRPAISHDQDGRTQLAVFATGTSKYEVGGNSSGMYLALSIPLFHPHTSPIAAATPSSFRFPVRAERFDSLNSITPTVVAAPAKLSRRAAHSFPWSAKKLKRVCLINVPNGLSVSPCLKTDAVSV